MEFLFILWIEQKLGFVCQKTSAFLSFFGLWVFLRQTLTKRSCYIFNPTSCILGLAIAEFVTPLYATKLLKSYPKNCLKSEKLEQMDTFSHFRSF